MLHLRSLTGFWIHRISHSHFQRIRLLSDCNVYHPNPWMGRKYYYSYQLQGPPPSSIEMSLKLRYENYLGFIEQNAFPLYTITILITIYLFQRWNLFLTFKFKTPFSNWGKKCQSEVISVDNSHPVITCHTDVSFSLSEVLDLHYENHSLLGEMKYNSAIISVFLL